jgi:Transposase DDE domain
VHLLAAMDHTSRAVLAQADVDDTTNEVTRFRPLLEGLDLAGRVITADALHPQHAHADWLVSVKQAAYLLIVKANQPAQPVPAGQPAVARDPRRRPHPRPRPPPRGAPSPAGHHRRTPGLPPRHQAIRITRRVRPLAGRRWRTVVVYAVTSLSTAQAPPRGWLTGSGATGASKRCIISATSPSPRAP